MTNQVFTPIGGRNIAGRTPIACSMISIGLAQLPIPIAPAAEHRQVVVVEAVIGDDVALGMHPRQQIRASPGVCADDEKRRPHVEFPEDIQHGRRRFARRAIVERQRVAWLPPSPGPRAMHRAPERAGRRDRDPATCRERHRAAAAPRPEQPSSRSSPHPRLESRLERRRSHPRAAPLYVSRPVIVITNVALLTWFNPPCVDAILMYFSNRG